MRRATTTKTSSATGGRKSAGSSRSGSTRKKSGKKPGTFRSLWQLLTMTFFGRVVTAILGLALLVAIDLYAVSFRYDLFFTVLGIEAAIVGVLLWIRFLVWTRPEKAG